MIGKIWHNEGPMPKLPIADAPVISTNLAKKQASSSSWSDDDNIMDLANDDDFTTSWVANSTVKNPWYEIDFDREKAFNTISIAEDKPNITRYRLEFYRNSEWIPIFNGENNKKVKINRFETVWGSKVRVWIDQSDHQASIAEFGVYNERR